MRAFEKLFIGVVLLLFLQIAQYGIYQTQKTSNPSQNAEIKGENTANISVVKVIDGDTIQVMISGRKETVRVIGINTPETVDPRREVECFGVEASSEAKKILNGQRVRLEPDPSQADRDKYGRLLRYVWLPDNIDFGLKMIKEGYAYEYTYDKPYKYQTKYKKAQNEAEIQEFGLWKGNSCGEN